MTTRPFLKVKVNPGYRLVPPTDALDIATKATLEATHVPNATGTINLLGYAAAGDGGGGMYVRSVSEPTHPGKIQDADGDWWELKEPRPRVSQFGAVDGASDATAAFTSAAEYAIDTGCLNFGIDPWDHQLYTGLSITTTENFEIWGFDEKSRIRPHGDLHVLTIDKTGSDSRSIWLHDFKIGDPVGGSAGGNSVAITLTQGNAGLIDNIHFGDYDKILDYGIVMSKCSDITIQNCKFRGLNGNAIRAISDYTAQANKFINNLFFDCGELLTSAAITVGADAGQPLAVSPYIALNDFALCYVSIECRDCTSMLIVSNYMEQPRSRNFSFLTGTVNNTSIRFIGNTINSADPATPGVAGASTFSYLSDAKFDGNIFLNWDITFDNTCDGIRCRNYENYFYNSTQTGADEWNTTTPTVNPVGGPGAFSASASIGYRQEGKLVDVDVSLVVSNAGTATALNFDLPVTPTQRVTIHGSANDGRAYHLDNVGSGANVALYLYDNTTTPVATTYRFSGSYRVS